MEAGSGFGCSSLRWHCPSCRKSDGGVEEDGRRDVGGPGGCDASGDRRRRRASSARSPSAVDAGTGRTPGTKVATWQNLNPSFPWIMPGWRAWGRNPRKGRDQILQRSVAEP